MNLAAEIRERARALKLDKKSVKKIRYHVVLVWVEEALRLS